MKKKSFEIQKWMFIAGIPACLGVILLFARTVVTFADMPKRVDTIEQYIQAQVEANRVQAKANELIQQQLQNQQQQPSCQWYEKKYWCWDAENQIWVEVKNGR